MNLLAKGKSDVHQCIEREPRNTATQQIVDPRLGDAAVFGGRGLRPTAVLDKRGDLSHQLGADLEVGGFLGSVGKRIPDAGEPLLLRLGHGYFLVSWVKRCFASSISRFDVACVFFWKAWST